MAVFTISRGTRRAALVLGCWATLATAQQPVSDTAADYSHAIPVTVSGKNAVVQLRVPQAVYLNARSAALHDLRVFDASGKALPFALMQPASQSQASRRELPVTVFPVTNALSQSAVKNDFEIKTSADGAVTSITTRHGAQPKAGADGARLDALVFDMGKADGARPAFDALAFTLPEGMSNYHAQVELEVSDDLRGWETLGNASLSWLANNERQTLVSNRMEFAPRAFRYARLTWREGTPVQFARIVAESPTQTDLPPALESIVIEPVAGKFAGDVVYNAAPAIPVRRLNVQFSERQNVVLPALLGDYVELPAVKGTSTTRWDFRPRLQATFFQITQDGRQRKSGDVILDEVHESRWVLRPRAATSDQPALRLSWIPATLVFMASGPGPYSISFGRADAKPAQLDVAQVAPGFSAAELQSVEQAVAGQLKAGGVRPAATSDAEAASGAARTRMLMLWGVLLLGVGVLAFMAWRLIGQMKNGEQ